MTISPSQKFNQSTESTEPPSPEPKRPIWETVAEIGAQIPEQDWAGVPEDGSINYRHYLYGADKHN